mmetsp:Transcript_12198/g.51324  ORF Transcript_12198/g.51324 Transcript_12198/m.51324 type:complete len:219 (+) Transcript_12198:923-1579(+)
MRVPGRGRIEALHRTEHLRDAAEVPAAVHREEQDDPGGIGSVLRGGAVRRGVGVGGFEGTRGRGRVGPFAVARGFARIRREDLRLVPVLLDGVDDERAVEIVHAARFVQSFRQVIRRFPLRAGVQPAKRRVQPGVSRLRAGPPAVPQAPVHVILAVRLHDEEPHVPVARLFTRLQKTREPGAVEGGSRGNLERVTGFARLGRGGAPERVAKVGIGGGG